MKTQPLSQLGNLNRASLLRRQTTGKKVFVYPVTEAMCIRVDANVHVVLTFLEEAIVFRYHLLTAKIKQDAERRNLHSSDTRRIIPAQLASLGGEA